MPEARLGTIPGWGGTGRLTRLIGAPRAQLVDAAAAGAPAAILEAIASGFTSYTADFAEGVNAFLDKRAPHFTAK